jgi:hypothetical protein
MFRRPRTPPDDDDENDRFLLNRMSSVVPPSLLSLHNRSTNIVSELPSLSPRQAKISKSLKVGTLHSRLSTVGRSPFKTVPKQPTLSSPEKPLEPVGASNEIVKGLPSKNKSGNTQHQSKSPTIRKARIPTFRSQPDFISEANKNQWITPDTFEAPKIIQEISLVDPKREEALKRYIKYGFPIVTVLGAAHALYKGYEWMTQ